MARKQSPLDHDTQMTLPAPSIRSRGVPRLLTVVGVALAVLLGWLGVESLGVHYRRQAWRQIEAAGGIVCANYAGPIVGVTLPNYVHLSPRKPLSSVRMQLGDLPVMAVLLAPDQANDDFMRHVKALFPEAYVVPATEWKSDAAEGSSERTGATLP